MGLGLDGRPQPLLHLAGPQLGDRVALAVRSRPRRDLTRADLAVAGEPGEGGVDLTEREGPAPAEVGVVVALEVVAVAGLPLQQAEEGQGNVHGPKTTLKVYSQSIAAEPDGSGRATCADSARVCPRRGVGCGKCGTACELRVPMTSRYRAPVLKRRCGGYPACCPDSPTCPCAAPSSSWPCSPAAMLPRIWNSLFSATSSPSFAARFRDPSWNQPTEPCSPRSAACCHGPAGCASSSPRRRCCAGTGG